MTEDQEREQLTGSKLSWDLQKFIINEVSTPHGNRELPAWQYSIKECTAFYDELMKSPEKYGLVELSKLKRLLKAASNVGGNMSAGIDHLSPYQVELFEELTKSIIDIQGYA